MENYGCFNGMVSLDEKEIVSCQELGNILHLKLKMLTSR
jgi:hypothetical protein